MIFIALLVILALGMMLRAWVKLTYRPHVPGTCKICGEPSQSGDHDHCQLEMSAW